MKREETEENWPLGLPFKTERNGSFLHLFRENNALSDSSNSETGKRRRIPAHSRKQGRKRRINLTKTRRKEEN